MGGGALEKLMDLGTKVAGEAAVWGPREQASADQVPLPARGAACENGDGEGDGAGRKKEGRRHGRWCHFFVASFFRGDNKHEWVCMSPKACRIDEGNIKHSEIVGNTIWFGSFFCLCGSLGKITALRGC